MFSVNDLPEVKVKNKLAELGALGPYFIDSSLEPEPLLQIGMLDVGSIPKNERCICILANGTNNQETAGSYEDSNVSIIVVGLSDNSDSVNVKMIAHAINNIIVENKEFVEGCVFGFVSSGVNGPFFEGDNRVIFDITCRVLINK